MPTYTNPNKSWQEQQSTPTIAATALQNPPAPLQVKPYVDPITPDPLALIPQPDASNVNNLQTEQSYIMDALNSATTQMGNQAARAQELSAQYGIPDAQKAYNETINQIRTLNSDAFNARMKSEDRLAPMFAITGEQASIERQRSARSYGLAASAEAMKGNIALAQQYVQTALDAEFKPLEARISFLRDVLETNKSNLQREDAKLSAAESRRFDAVMKKLDMREKEITRQREDKSTILNVAKLAGSNLAPNDVIQKITQAKTPEEAMMLAGQYIQDPKTKMELESIRLENQLRREQIQTARVQRAQIGAANAKDQVALNAAKAIAVESATTVRKQAGELAALIRAGRGNSIIGGSRLLNAGKFLPGTKAAEVDARFNQLKDSLAAANLDKLKGAMSDKDIEFLRNIGTSLRLDLPEEAFLAELGRITTTMDTKVMSNVISKDERSVIYDVPQSQAPITNPAALFN